VVVVLEADKVQVVVVLEVLENLLVQHLVVILQVH
jgi:hypothetical protein